MSPIEQIRAALEAVRAGEFTLDDLADALTSWEKDQSAPILEVVRKLASPDVSAPSSAALLDGLELGSESDLPDLDFDLPSLGDAAPSSAGAPGPGPSIPPDTGSYERYIMGIELGRGGLGRVMAAVDRVLGRPVAVKEMTRGADNNFLLQRFLREGEVAGRLMHPNIVPVFDVGVRQDREKRLPYFVMGQIKGRDLFQILHPGPEEPLRSGFTLPQLLGIFQDVCLAMAYAHDHDVIHRDLKPANVMVGDYGEVYVVDWGLAKVMGSSDEAPDAEPPDARSRPAAPGIETDRTASAGAASRPGPARENPPPTPESVQTMAGEVLGTPSYMPPEQARGETAEIDERSDIYSLGAILYEILTLRPPYEGPSNLNILARVMKDDITPPSQRVSEVRSRISQITEGDTIVMPAHQDLPTSGILTSADLPDDVPRELEDVVLKAMARNKADRFSSVRELHDDVQQYLEGEKEKKRNAALADETVQRGRGLMTSLTTLREKHAELTELHQRLRKDQKAHWPVERLRPVWEMGEKIQTVRDDIVRTFTRAVTTLQSAFGYVPGHGEARAALAQLYWEQFLREEAAGARAEMIQYENLVREYNDGQYDLQLRGDGLLSVHAFTYPCRCLTDGREVAPAEFDSPPGETQEALRYGLLGNHPLSGRSLDGQEEASGIPAYEPDRPGRLFLHRHDCVKQPDDGADLWLFAYREQDQMLVPSEPSGTAFAGCATEEIPAGLTDTLYAPRSPYRPRRGLHLGASPVDGHAIPMGSYLLLAFKDGHAPQRVPFLVKRNARVDLELTFFRPEEIPHGFVQVPAGPYIYQGDTELPSSEEAIDLWVDDFFIARHPVTCREYLDFLNDLAARDAVEAARRVPRASETSGPYWPVDERGHFHIPTARWLSDAPEALRDQGKRLAHAADDWEEDWPVLGISWEDALAYAAHARCRTPHLYTLPTGYHWEKAARGVDGRWYTWGNGYVASYCNGNQTFPDGMRPVSVHHFPQDESPYGVFGTAGNAVDPCIEYSRGLMAGWRIFRGGSWGSANLGVRAAYKLGIMTTAVYPPRGSIRLFVPPKLGDLARRFTGSTIDTPSHP